MIISVTHKVSVRETYLTNLKLISSEGVVFPKYIFCNNVLTIYSAFFSQLSTVQQCWWPYGSSGIGNVRTNEFYGPAKI